MALPPRVFIAASKVRRVRSEAFSKNRTICLASRAWRKSSGWLLDGVSELHDGGHLLHGEVGDGAEVAAGEAFGGFGEGGVGLDAERDGRLAVRRFRCVHDEGLAVHEIDLGTHGCQFYVVRVRLADG